MIASRLENLYRPVQKGHIGVGKTKALFAYFRDGKISFILLAERWVYKETEKASSEKLGVYALTETMPILKKKESHEYEYEYVIAGDTLYLKNKELKESHLFGKSIQSSVAEGVHQGFKGGITEWYYFTENIHRKQNSENIKEGCPVSKDFCLDALSRIPLNRFCSISDLIKIETKKDGVLFTQHKDYAGRESINREVFVEASRDWWED